MTARTTARIQQPQDYQYYFAYAADALTILAISYTANRWWIGIPLLFIIALHSLLSERFRFRQRTVYYLLLALPFAMLSRELPVDGWVEGMGLSINLACYGGLYLCSLAVMQLYIKGRENLIPVTVGATGLAFGAASVGISHRLYIVGLAIYAILLFGLFRAQHPKRTISMRTKQLQTRAIFITFNFCIVIAVALIFVAKEQLPKLKLHSRRWTSWTPQSESIGFSDSSTLNSISERRNTEQESRISIRAFSKKGAPGYLRGKVYNNYGNRKWVTIAKENHISLTGHPDYPNGFHVMAGRSEPNYLLAPDMVIYPTVDHGGIFFLPLMTSAIQTPNSAIRECKGNIIRPRQRSTARGYGVYMEDTPIRRIEETQPQAKTAYLNLPPYQPNQPYSLRTRLESVVADNFADLDAQQDTDELITRMADYFAAHYTYKIGIEYSPDRDPLEEFLANDRLKHGHCELFASSGVLLLRTMGIPARYVTGYVCLEKSNFDSSYIARERNAHAWVEYYHPQDGWRIAEFTPPGGQSPFNSLETWEEFAYSLWRRLEGFLLREGLMGVLNLAFGWLRDVIIWLIDVWYRGVIFLLLVAGGIAFFLWRRRTKTSSVTYNRIFPTHIEDQRQAFAVLQKRLRKQDLGKQESETLREYHSRLASAQPFPEQQEALAFLEKFEAIRYAPFSSTST